MPQYPNRRHLTGYGGGRMQLMGASGGAPVGTPAAYGGGGSMQVEEGDFSQARAFPIGLEAAIVNIGATALIDVKPQVVFRTERFAVAASLATFFDIATFAIGKDSQFASNVPVPAECLDNRSTGVRWLCDTAQPGIDITVNVTNNDTVSHAFKAIIVGSVMQ